MRTIKLSTTAISLLLAVLLIAACGRAQDSAGPSWREQYDLGMRYLSQGNYQEAVIAFQAAIDIDPRSADAHVGLGQAYVGLGEHQSAASAFQTAIGIDSVLVDAYLGLAEAYIGLGNMEAALDTLREGYEATNDERLLRRIEELQPSGGGAGSDGGVANGGDSSGEPVRSPYGDVLPPELTVLLRQESLRYSDEWHMINTLEYDSYGYLILMSDDSEAVAVNEYDETAGKWLKYIFFDGELQQQRDSYHFPGTYNAAGLAGNVQRYPWPEPSPERERLRDILVAGGRMPDNRPERIVNQNPYDAQDWVYAICEYDENNNLIKITSFNDDGEIGYCTLEWAVLVLGPDGIYTVRSID